MESEKRRHSPIINYPYRLDEKKINTSKEGYNQGCVVEDMSIKLEYI